MLLLDESKYSTVRVCKLPFITDQSLKFGTVIFVNDTLLLPILPYILLLLLYTHGVTTHQTSEKNEKANKNTKTRKHKKQKTVKKKPLTQHFLGTRSHRVTDRHKQHQLQVTESPSHQVTESQFVFA